MSDSHPIGAAAAALALLSAGDFSGLLRKLRGQIAKRPELLPADLKPNPRPAGVRVAARADSPRILMVGTSLALDGAPMSQFELAEGLVKTGFALSVMVQRDGPLRARYAAAGIPVTVRAELACSPAVPAWYEQDVARMAAAFAGFQPDLIFASTVDSFPAIDAARAAGIPSLWNIRESEPWRARLADRHTAIAARALACFSYPHAMIFVAKSSADVWAPFIPASHSQVILNGAHPSRLAPPQKSRAAVRAELGVSEAEKLIVSVGTLCPRKNQRELADTFSRLDPAFLASTRVAFIGRDEGGYEAAVRSALSSTAAARTMFTGPVDDALSLTAAADLIVNTSVSEAFPRTLIEAAAVRTPIIASAIDGAIERLADGRSAELYKPGDIATLASKLAALLTDPARARSLAEAAHRDLIEAWTYDDMLKAYAAQVRAALTADAPT